MTPSTFAVTWPILILYFLCEIGVNLTIRTFRWFCNFYHLGGVLILATFPLLLGWQIDEYQWWKIALVYIQWNILTLVLTVLCAFCSLTFWENIIEEQSTENSSWSSWKELLKICSTFGATTSFSMMFFPLDKPAAR